MNLHQILAGGLVSLALAAPAQAADFADPTWPCLQRKVANLSIGLMWPHPVEPVEMAPDMTRDVKVLAENMALRRVPIETVQALVTDFVATHDADTALLGTVFEQVFTPLAKRRGQVIQGIEKFSLSQIAMTERIDQARADMDQLMAADAPDFDKVDQLEEQIDWDQRIYTDRQKSLTYVCETPVLLEKRLFAIAQMLMAAVDE